MAMAPETSQPAPPATAPRLPSDAAATSKGKDINDHELPTHPTSACPEQQHALDRDAGGKYPEGGLQAWLVVLGAWCAMLPSMGLLNTIGVLQAWVAEHQLAGYSESNIAWIFSTYAFFLYITGAQVGGSRGGERVRERVVCESR
jgi:hypothetical protein